MAIRNIRRDANDEVKKLEKSGELTEDDRHKGLDDVQELTDQKIKEVDEALELKEAEIMEI